MDLPLDPARRHTHTAAEHLPEQRPDLPPHLTGRGIAGQGSALRPLQDQPQTPDTVSASLIPIGMHTNNCPPFQVESWDQGGGRGGGGEKEEGEVCKEVDKEREEK